MNYLATSGRWCAQYGRGHDNLAGQNHYQVLSDQPAEWQDIHQRVLAGETVSREVDLWIQADGSQHWLNWTAVPWIESGGRIGGMIISAEDISQRRAMDAGHRRPSGQSGEGGR